MASMRSRVASLAPAAAATSFSSVSMASNAMRHGDEYRQYQRQVPMFIPRSLSGNPREA